MTDNTTQTRTDIEPMVPIMPESRPRPDGGEPQPRAAGEPRREPPTPTDHATEYERDCEEIEPLVEPF
jgi:hypothetical protein